MKLFCSYFNLLDDRGQFFCWSMIVSFCTMTGMKLKLWDHLNLQFHVKIIVIIFLTICIYCLGESWLYMSLG